MALPPQWQVRVPRTLPLTRALARAVEPTEGHIRISWHTTWPSSAAGTGAKTPDLVENQIHRSPTCVWPTTSPPHITAVGSFNRPCSAPHNRCLHLVPHYSTGTSHQGFGEGIDPQAWAPDLAMEVPNPC